MRREKELIDDVDVHARTQETRRRTHSNNGNLHRVFDAPQVRWYHRIFKWETLTVAGRTIEKGIVLTPVMCLTLILAIATMVGTVYWRMSDRIEAKDNAYQQQRDMLIEIKTELKIRKEHDVEKFEHIEKRFQNSDAVQIVLGRDIAKLNAQRGN